MRVHPRYDGDPVLQFDAPVGDPSIPLIRQRRRLADILTSLEDAQWSTASRCEGWSVRDVIAHLVGTNGFWLLSVRGALADTPTRYLAEFDPVATPKLGVEQMREMSPGDVLASYRQGVEELATLLGDLNGPQWAATAEAPPGHIALHAMARHALWDAWIHERDVCIPLGLPLSHEPDELRACLEYVAALGPAILATEGSTRSAVLVIDGTKPDAHLVVEVGANVVVRSDDVPTDAVRLAGPTVDLIEALSFRAPLPEGIAEDARWLFEGLGTLFEV